MSAAEILLEERAGHRLTLTLNRPERRNALSGPLVAALTAALAKADADPEVRVVVITAAGEQAFCAGGDLGGELGAGGVAEVARGFAGLIRTMEHLGTPLVARVNGHCMGGGLGLLLGCDLAVAVDDIKLGTPEVRSGLFPMMIAPLIERHVGPKRARALFFTGQRIEAATALAWGMINRLAPRSGLDDATDELVAEVLASGPAAIRLGRKALAAIRGRPLDEVLDELAEQLVAVLSTEDAMEGIAAFLQKRKPNWKNN